MAKVRIALTGLSACLWVSIASAEPAPHDPATAQALFDDGKRLMEAGRFEDACPKLVESQRLDPGGGTLLAIALCHEKQGKTATAWADFNVALSDARRDHRSDREGAALDHIKALEGRLTRVRVVLSTEAKVNGLEVTRDGVRVGEPQWGTPLPVDPGTHQFGATAPGRVGWRSTLDVQGEGRVLDVVVPALALEAASVPVPAATSHESSEPEGSARSSRLLLAAVVGGVGLVATGVGLGFGLSASSTWDDAQKASDHDLGKSAGTAADISTVGFTLGAVGIMTGVILWLTAPDAPAKKASAVRFTARGIAW